MNTLIQLNKFNNIKFDEPTHIYRVGDKEYKSTTTLLAEYMRGFDVEAQSLKYSEKHDLGQEEVKKDWAKKKFIGGTKGSAVHLVAENYFKNKETPYPDSISILDDDTKAKYEKEVELFKMFYNDYKDILVPVSLELVVYDEDYGLAGMVDCLFFNRETEELEIWDYKTNKNMREANYFDKEDGKMLAPLQEFDECEMNKFSFQLEIYKNIIEKNTNLKLGQSTLIWLNNKNDSYKILPTKEVRVTTQILLNEISKKKQVKKEIQW